MSYRNEESRTPKSLTLIGCGSTFSFDYQINDKIETIPQETTAGLSQINTYKCSCSLGAIITQGSQERCIAAGKHHASKKRKHLR